MQPATIVIASRGGRRPSILQVKNGAYVVYNEEGRTLFLAAGDAANTPATIRVHSRPLAVDKSGIGLIRE